MFRMNAHSLLCLPLLALGCEGETAASESLADTKASDVAGSVAITAPNISAAPSSSSSKNDELRLPNPSPVARVEAGKVEEGRTSDNRHWVGSFTYSQPPEATTWLSFVEARDLCRAEDLGLCSLQQLDRVCSVAPDVGKLETWTTNYTADGKLWTHGGDGCGKSARVTPDEQSPSRGVLCCERRPAIVLSTLQKGDRGAKSTSVYMSLVEKSMNSRIPDDVIKLAADSFYLYSSKKLRDKADARKAMGFDLSNGTEFDNRLVVCDAKYTEGGKQGEFECESVITRKMNTKQFRDLGLLSLRFRFIPPKYQYDTWAVGTRIVRNFTPIQ